MSFIEGANCNYGRFRFGVRTVLKKCAWCGKRRLVCIEVPVSQQDWSETEWVCRKCFDKRGKEVGVVDGGYFDLCVFF